MARILANWLESYEKFTENSEPPVQYKRWVGISMIAAALQRKVWLKWGTDTLYPNLYIVLVGPPGKCRKGTAMRAGRWILDKVGVPMASESITREALIRALGECDNSFRDPDTGEQRPMSALTAFSEELVVFLGSDSKANSQFIADLCDLFDCGVGEAGKWEYRTKTAGTDTLFGVWLNIVGATTPDLLQSSLPLDAIGGGLTSRIIFIVAHQKGKIVADPTLTPAEEQLRLDLVHDLEQIALICGQFSFTEEARQFYNHWYTQYAHSEGIPYDPRFAGYNERRSTHLRKLSIIHRMSYSDERLISTEDLEGALTWMYEAEHTMSQAFGALGTWKFGATMTEVLAMITRNPWVPQDVLIRRFYKDVDYTSMCDILTTLEKGKWIEVRARRSDLMPVYKALPIPEETAEDRKLREEGGYLVGTKGKKDP